MDISSPGRAAAAMAQAYLAKTPRGATSDSCPRCLARTTRDAGDVLAGDRLYRHRVCESCLLSFHVGYTRDSVRLDLPETTGDFIYAAPAKHATVFLAHVDIVTTPSPEGDGFLGNARSYDLR